MSKNDIVRWPLGFIIGRHALKVLLLLFFPLITSEFTFDTHKDGRSTLPAILQKWSQLVHLPQGMSSAASVCAGRLERGAPRDPLPNPEQSWAVSQRLTHISMLRNDRESMEIIFWRQLGLLGWTISTITTRSGAYCVTQPTTRRRCWAQYYAHLQSVTINSNC